MKVNLVVMEFLGVVSLIWRAQVPVGKSDSPNVLHGVDSELGAVDHIVLGEGEGVIEHLRIELDASRYHSEHQIAINVILFARPDKDPHGRFGVLSLVLNNLVVTGTEVKDVRADRRRQVKLPEPQIPLLDFVLNKPIEVVTSVSCVLHLCKVVGNFKWFCFLRPVRNDLPVFSRGENLQSERASDAGLIEAREEPVAEERLQVRKNVSFRIGVLVVVQTRAVCHVGVLEAENKPVIRLQLLCRYPNFVFLKLDVRSDALTVEVEV